MFHLPVSALELLRDIIRDGRWRFGMPPRSRIELRAEQLAGLVFRPTKTSTEELKMAEQAEELSISAKSVPLLPPRPVPPHPADLLPPRMSAPPAIESDLSTALRGDPAEPRHLIVGHGVSLSGEITSCARLLIEGNVEANLHDCHDVDIAEGGLFKGVASIDNAEVRGRFEGDLVVRKRLLIRATGHVSGKITYSEIEIEHGGKISGQVEVHREGDLASHQPRARRAASAD
jgi:cytoskeletal protein CcmA (bactofilin family)